MHAKSVDLWIVQAGTATAITGGELLDKKKSANAASDDVAGSSIRGGIEQPLKPGDIIFVPPGVPHGFKDLKGFRAFLCPLGSKVNMAGEPWRSPASAPGGTNRQSMVRLQRRLPFHVLPAFFDFPPIDAK